MKYKYFLSFLVLALFYSCSSTKNTRGTRWYHSFTTRYNVYFNGDQAYRTALKAQETGYKENYTELLKMYAVSDLPKDKQTTGGPFDKSAEKAVKAIKTHSIQTKPPRDPKRTRDPRYQEFMARTEYNPFLHNAWMLMGKSQFHNGDFLEAATTFSYTARLYSTQKEISDLARLWQARSYAELTWFYEAEDVYTKLDTTSFTPANENVYHAFYADYLIKQKRYGDAIPYLKTAIQHEKDKVQKTRHRYLLGQLYARTGQPDEAYQTFGQVNSAYAPYIIEFNARIRQTEVFPGGDTTKVAKQLRKMTKSSKNKDYLDQIYYALGNVYLTVPDTTKAIESYLLGVELSSLQGLDKALNQISLGDIYFHQREYIDAQPNYSEALGQLKKEHDAYPRVAKRSEVLDALVIHYEAVELQDSLQRLSKMTEDEQMAVVKQLIADLIKREEEEKLKAEKEEFLALRDELQAQTQPQLRPQPLGTVDPAMAGVFYFYNPQLVTQGKTSFQQKWGRRKLEDDWRRRNKSNPMGSFEDEMDLAEEETEALTEGASDQPLTDEVAMDEEGNLLPIEEQPVVELSTDPKDPQFYLQQIPKTEEEIAESNLIIEDGLFQMAMIYKDLLEDLDLALETFQKLDARFPDNENKQEAYYQTYLIYLRKGDQAMANTYKQKIRELFPDTDMAIAMADPDYEENIRTMDVIQNTLYRESYEAYLDGNISLVRSNYQLIQEKYTQTKLMPKFMFLNALTYVQENDADRFKAVLRDLIARYPEADVTLLAAEIMKGFQRGLILSASGNNLLAQGSLFNFRIGGEDLENDPTAVFTDEKQTPYELLLIYPPEGLNDNLLLYTVASYNFGKFQVNSFDLEKTTFGPFGLLKVKGFKSFDEINQYVTMIHQPDGYTQGLENVVVIVPIATSNLSLLMRGKSLDEYLSFFEEHFTLDDKTLVEKWHLKQAQELEEINESAVEETTEGVGEDESTIDQEAEEPVVAPETEEEPATPTEEPQPEETEATPAVDPTDEAMDDLFNDTYDTFNDVNSTLNEIATDPVRGIMKLFERKGKNSVDEFVRQQEKEEKERMKELKKAQTEREKQALIKQREEEKAQREAEKMAERERKAAEKAKKDAEKEKELQAAQAKKAAEAEKIRLQKEREAERKALQKQREEERKALQKQRDEERKQREQERKELQKQRDAERKALQKQREEERKQREAERKNR